MKINCKRAGISQSLDLFIIVGAVLAVGGIVTSSVFGLVNGNSQSTAMQITSISASGGTNANTLVNSFNIVVKNIGSSAISGNMTVTLVGTKQDTNACAQAPTAVTTTGSSTGIWSLGCASGSPLSLKGPSTTLAPGGEISVSLGAVTGASAPTTWKQGVVQTVTVTLGVASASATVTS